MGIAISPGQPATVYRDAITDHRRTKGEAPLPLDDAVWDDDDGPDAPPPPPPLPDDEDAVMLGPPEEDRKPKPAPKPSKKAVGPPTAAAPTSGGGGASGSGGPGGTVPCPVAPPIIVDPTGDAVIPGLAIPPIPAPVPGEASEDSEDAVVLGPPAEGDEDAPAPAPREARDYLVGPTGCKLFWKAYFAPGSATPSPNWYMKCSHHGGCGKRKGCHRKATEVHGNVEPIVFFARVARGTLATSWWKTYACPGDPKHRSSGRDGGIVCRRVFGSSRGGNAAYVLTKESYH